MGGTAFFDHSNTEKNVKTKRLSDVTLNPGMIKLDTDGHDFKILLSNSDVLKKYKPALIFESQIKTKKDYTDSCTLLDHLTSIDYKFCCIFDDQGYLILLTDSFAQVKRLHYFMVEQITDKTPRISFSNLDICCFHKEEQTMFDQFCKKYKLE